MRHPRLIPSPRSATTTAWAGSARLVLVTALALTSGIAVSTPRAAWAQPSDARAAAEILFNEARTLAEKRDFAGACPKFEASLRLDPALGTRLNLGDCYEQIGKLASAWAMFKAAADSARVQGDVREKLASDRASRLEPRLPRLSVRVEGDGVPGMTLVRSGSAMEQAMLGSPTFVDPGRIEITASAPDHETFTTSVEAKEGELVEVVIPVLTRSSGAGTGPGEGPGPVPPKTMPRPGRGRAMVGLGVAGGGVALLAGGVVAGLSARSLWNDAFDSGLCDHDTHQCSPDGQAQTDRARSRVLVANLLGGAGLVAVGVGTYLYLTAPRGGERPASAMAWTPTVGPDHVGVTFAGGF